MTGPHPRRSGAAIPPGLYARTRALVAAASVDRGYDVPYLANRNRAGTVVYIDRRVPERLRRSGIKPNETLPWHELAEWLAQNGGETYPRAHAVATAVERRRVEELGGDWAQYTAEMDGFIREVGDERITRVPADIDLRPYDDEHDRHALTELKQGCAASKSTFAAPAAPTSGLAAYDLDGSNRISKAEAEYAAGPVAAEPCRHCASFARPSSCARVEGAVAPEGHCKHWAATPGAAAAFARHKRASEGGHIVDLKRLFIPIVKVDAAQRLVYGLATAEVADKANEVCDYATTKPYYEKWSAEIAKATDGRSLGNLRVMHGNVAAGKITKLAFNDEAKEIEICAKVVDNDEWRKVEEGVYTGFSHGGKYVRRWRDPDNPEFTRYTAEPVEVSLVDVPCLPNATFEMIKDDGTRERRPFRKTDDGRHPCSPDGAPRSGAQSGTESPDCGAQLRTSIGATGCPSPAWEDYEQVWQSRRDGATFRKKADLLAHHRALAAAEAAEAVAGPALDALQDLTAALAQPGDGEAPPPPAASSPLDLIKRGARNSAADLERLKAIHDLTVELGVDCTGAGRAGDDGDFRADSPDASTADASGKIAAPDELAKIKDDFARTAAERDALRKVLADLPGTLAALKASVDALKAERDELLKEIAAGVKAIEAQPAVAPPRAGYVVSKDGTTQPLGAGAESGGHGATDKALDGIDPKELALALIRKAHQNPQPAFGRAW